MIENEEGKLFAQPILYLQGSDEKKAELVFKNTRKVEKPSQNNPDTVKGKTENQTDEANQTKSKNRRRDRSVTVECDPGCVRDTSDTCILAEIQKKRGGKRA